MAGQPKPAFYVAVGVVVLALIGFAIYRSDIFAPRPIKPTSTEPIKLPGADKGPEDPKSTADLTTVKEFEIVPAQSLPPVKDVSSYTPLEKTGQTVIFAINVWAGWGPIFLANEGDKPKKIWKTAEGKEFKVELRLIDKPVDMRNNFTQGQIHIGWATLDMLPLFLEEFVKAKDSRIMPRVYQQIDWSNGGDGIVARDAIKTVANLRGKRIVLAQHSPSHYFALNMLVNGGVQPTEVKMDYTADAFQAAAAFNGDKANKYAGAVSWSPDIYNLANVPGNRLLVTTKEASKLIADVWFARADFARDHPDIVEALVRGIFDAMETMDDQDQQKRAAELMAKTYDMKPADALAMLGDAHNTNWAENYQFFVNENNPTNFKRVWENAYFLYRHPQVKVITHEPVPFDQVMDFTYIKKLGNEEKYAKQKEKYQKLMLPASVDRVVEQPEILGKRYEIRFPANSSEIYHKITRTRDGKAVEEFYDVQVDFVLEDIAKLAGQFAGARILIEGHTDSSMKDQVPKDALQDLITEVKKLSESRANAVKQALVAKYKFDSNQFTVAGRGWDRPSDPRDPKNHAKNRRVEVKVYSAESGGN